MVLIKPQAGQKAIEDCDSAQSAINKKATKSRFLWEGALRSLQRPTASNSTSNFSVAFGGMTPPAPRAP
jgi:hypothetical protein